MLSHAGVPIWATDARNVLVSPMMSAARIALATAGPTLRQALVKAYNDAVSTAPQGRKGKQVVLDGPFLPFPANMDPSDHRLLSQLRTGCCTTLGGWRHNVPDTCPWCDSPRALARDGAAVRHLFTECTAQPIQMLRAQHKVDLSALGCDPPAAIRFARACFALRDENAA